MIGLICIGLMGLGGVVFFTVSNRAQEAAVVSVSPTVILPTFTPTGTPTATPTDTPLPTPTSTPVIKSDEGDEAAAVTPDTSPPGDTPTIDPNATPTNTRVVQTTAETPTPTATPAAAAEMPSSGDVLSVERNGFLIWAGIGLVVLLVVGLVKQFSLISSRS